MIETILPDGSREEARYDFDNNLISSIDANGNRTNMVYDARGRLIRSVDPLGNTTSYEYDATNQLIATEDRNQNRTELEYDELKRQVKRTDALGGTFETTYDAVGNVLEEKDELGRITEYEYDARSRHMSSLDAEGGVTAYNYDDANNLLSVTDELNRTTTFTYDSRDRQVAITDPLNHTTTTIYDRVGNRIAVTDELNRTNQWTYDALNRQVEAIDPLNNTVFTEYDASDNIIAVTDSLSRKTRYEYDTRDRQTKTIDPLGRETTTEYDRNGNFIAVTNAEGYLTSYGYDVLNRQITIADAIAETTKITYDPEGNVIAIADPANNTTTYRYDELNRLIEEIDELGNTRNYTYDAVGNQTSITDGNNRVKKFSYDDLNRTIQEEWLDESNNPIHSISYTYDLANQLLAVSDENSSYSYGYDDAGQLTSVNNLGTSGVPNVVLNYTYDEVNNLRQLSDTIDGQQFGVETWDYDARNLVTQITQSGVNVADKRVNFTYDAVGFTTGFTYFSDLAGTQLVATSNYTYDSAGRLDKLTYANENNTLAEYEWSYDALNRITQLISADGTSNYDYDAQHQLTNAEYSFQDSETYTYETNGNRTNNGYQTGSDNQLTSDGTYNYEYDGEGNLIKRTKIATSEVMEFNWDYRNRLIQVMVKNSNGDTIKSIAYTYDVFDRRIAKEVDADGFGSATPSIERFVYKGNHISFVFDGNGNLVERYLYGPQIDQVLASDKLNGTTIWTLVDNQGTVRDLIDSNGIVQNHITYDSFGQIVEETNPDLDFRFGYTGREFDGETGLSYYRSRYYDPNVGRFISEDTIGFSGGDANLYRYVGNSPTNATDPMGLQMGSRCNPGYDILPPDVDTSQLCQTEEDFIQSSLTPIHRRIMSIAEQAQPSQGTLEWNLAYAALYDFELIDVDEFKNRWICGYRNVIKSAANEFDLPPILLAAIAHMEVGGMPPIVDDLGYALRDMPISGWLPGRFSVPANETSFGNYSIQVRTAADVLGYKPEQLNALIEKQIIESLKDPNQNIFIAAKYLAYLRNIYFPNTTTDTLSDRDLMTIAGAYNAGPRYYQELWDYGYAGGYGREAIQNRVTEHQIERLLQCGCE